jgi:hypothetical protein
VWSSCAGFLNIKVYGVHRCCEGLKYAVFCRGTDSILTKLRAYGVEDPSEYISFHGLRTYSVLNGELVCSSHSFKVQCMLLKETMTTELLPQKIKCTWQNA